jgi:uncharacterized membrane protein SpoIIM required for sporulation
MKESRFIEKNKDKWKRIEDHLASDLSSGNDLRADFIELTDDLSYAKTFYDKRSVRSYLNNLTTRVFHQIHRSNGLQHIRLVSFILHDIPLISFRYRRTLLLSLAIGILGFIIGFSLTLAEEDFPLAFFGPAYVEATIAHIEQQNPMAIYDQGSGSDMFLTITLNNLKVGLMIFISGIFFSIGSIGLTLINAIMVGVFTCFLYQHGVVKEFHLTVWQHGTIEILGMIVSCAAGIILGSSLLFPGSYSRSRAFYIHARSAITLYLSTLPLVVIAGFIESYFTRHQDLPDSLRISFIALSLLFMVGYYAILPFFKFYRKKNTLPEETTFERITSPAPISLMTLKTNQQMLTESVSILFQHIRKWLGPLLVLCISMSVVFVIFKDTLLSRPIQMFSRLDEAIIWGVYAGFRNLITLLEHTRLVAVPLMALFGATLTFIALRLFDGMLSAYPLPGPHKKRLWWVSFFVHLLMLLLWRSEIAIVSLIAPLLYPLCLSFSISLSLPRNDQRISFKYFMYHGLGKSLFLWGICLFTAFLLLILHMSFLFDMFTEAVQWIIYLDGNQYVIFIQWVLLCCAFGTLGCLSLLVSVSHILLTYHIIEQVTALGLKEKIRQIGHHKKKDQPETA